MIHGIEDRFQNPINIAAYSAAGFLVWWICLGVLTRFVHRRFGTHWAASQIAIGLGCLIGVSFAIAMKMSLLAWFLTAFVACSAVELAMHAVFGIKSVQGGPAHFTVIGAALFAVLGFLKLESRLLPDISVVIAGLLAFVIAEALSRLVFGTNRFRDRVTHVAIFLAAIVGAGLASVISANRGVI